MRKSCYYLIPIFITSFLFLQQNVIAQDLKRNVIAQDLKRNGILVEVQSSFKLYTLKYERSILQTEKTRVNASFGFSHSGPRANSHQAYWIGIPGGINVLFGKKNSHLELGLNLWMTRAIGVPFISYENIGQLMLGYRYQNYKKIAPILRLGIAPGYSKGFDYDINISQLRIGSYLSLGFAF